MQIATHEQRIIHRAQWLDEHNIERHIVEDNPTYDELKEWYAESGH